MSGTTQHTCPHCGVALESATSGALCPACLMSGVLRVDSETLPPDDDFETQSLAPQQHPLESQLRRQKANRLAFELPQELGDYTLVGLLGQGGMGTVYEAVQRSTGRRLAMKLLDQRLDSPEMRRRFLREGRLAARVNHPASLYVFGSEEISDIPVITMEIAPGGTLQDTLDRRGPLPVIDAIDALFNMIDGLEAALARGVLHRDIKPSNCFIAPDGTVQVGDFGLSVSTLPSADTFMTQTGKVMGTPAFASPEQLRGDEIDVRSDIYSVGATLFTLLTGRAVFEGENAVQVVANVIDTPPVPASQFREDLSPGLVRVIARCLAKEPANRYADYAELRDALLPFSSIVPEPATQAQRTAAGWIDYLAAFLPMYAALMVTVGPEALFIRPMYEFTFSAWSYHILLFGCGFLYFAVTEGVWGSGLGKWIMNLRVVTKTGRTPGVARAMLRIIIPIALIECIRIPLSIAVRPDGAWAPIDILLFIGLSIACPWLAALLWLTARRGNGFATVWDLATATRVVVRPRGSRRPVVVDDAATIEAKADTARELTGEVADELTGEVADDGTFEDGRCIGLFRVAAELQPGDWFLGDDPVLRRRVWLIRRVGNPPSAARRAAARPGRPRWLQEIEQGGAVWDAYEAALGTTFSQQAARGLVPWSILRYWLHDLASELRAAERDSTLPVACSLDHIWITDDGRAVLLDAPLAAASIPGTNVSGPCAESHAELIPVDSFSGQQRFLQAVAESVDALSVPLHAQPALQNLRGASYEKLTFLTGTLRGLLNKPADVSRGLRAASLFVIPGYAWIATFLGIASNTDASVGFSVWAGRAAIAGLVMMHIIALFDVVLAFWYKSTGLSTFGLEVVTERGRASQVRMLLRSLIMWLPVVVPTAALGIIALAQGTWVAFDDAAVVGAVALAGAAVCAVSALVTPNRGIHDRLAGVWVGRR